MANLATRVSRAAWPMVAALVRSIFGQPDRDQTWAKLAEVVDKLTAAGLDDVAEYLLDAAEDLLAFTAFPVEHWAKLRSNNPQERLNKEIRRRTDVVGIFPNRQAVIRLVGAVLAEQSDEWAVSTRYCGIESLKSGRILDLKAPEQPELEAASA
jgi:transposase-like protein